MGNRISQSFMLSLKCDHPFYVNSPSYFQHRSLKLEHNF